MEMVWKLQKTFYSSSKKEYETDEEPRPELDEYGCMLLPLWRVGWIEVPG